jgi:hypothetical protein
LIATIVVACVAALAMSSCSELDNALGEPPSSSTAPAGPAAAGSALSTLATLQVREEALSPRYDRDQFGESWKDVDGNGCDTRNDILQRDLEQETLREDGCTVLTGVLNDPYTGKVINFDRSRAASAVQIDHVVSLGDAWRTGALEWSDEMRLAIANDPENLLAVDGPENQTKSDDDASQWLPPVESFHCPLVARQIGVKARYGLWVTPAEQAAMQAVLATCPDQPTLGG